MATKPKQLSITPERFQRIDEIAKKYGLKLVVLFGSHVTGKLHTESDVDIAVLPERPLSFQNEMRLRADLVAVFDRVDVTNLGTAAKQPLLMFGIFQNAKVLFQNDPMTFPTYRAYAYKRYVETKSQYEERAKQVREKILAVRVLS